MNEASLKAEFRTEALYQAYRPSQDLQHFIHEFWIMHLDKAAKHTKAELELPNLYPEIIFKYGEDYEELHIHRNKKLIHNGSRISGINTYAKASKRVNTDHSLLMIGVKFKPLGMYALLNQPLYKLHDLIVPINEINKFELIELEEKLFYTKNRIEILNTLNNELRKIILKNYPDSESLRFTKTIDSFNHKSLLHFIKDEQYNYKYIERKFKKIIGANPGQYFKLKRFNSFYKDILLLGKYKYIDLVYKHNYYDQNHLIKEFKSIMNLPPNKFLEKSKTHFTQHITKVHLMSSFYYPMLH